MTDAPEKIYRWDDDGSLEYCPPAYGDAIEYTRSDLATSAAPASDDQVKDAARLILKSYDDRTDVRPFALALAFGQAAYEKASCQESGSVAFMRAMLTALIDPASPDLDYLRAWNTRPHARASLEPVGSDRVFYVCVACREGGEDYQLHRRDDMRVYDGQWYCTDCAREELSGRGDDTDEDDLPLAPELYTAPLDESEDVVRLREIASAAQYALEICDKWTDQIDPSDECETEIIEAREHHQHNTERLRAALAAIKGEH